MSGNYNETLRVRVTSEQLGSLESQAKSAGLKIPEFVRQQLFGSPTRSTTPAAFRSGPVEGVSADYVTKDELSEAIEKAIGVVNRKDNHE